MHSNQQLWIRRVSTLVLALAFLLTIPAGANRAVLAQDEGGSFLPITFGQPCPSVAQRTPTVFGVQMYTNTSQTSPYFTTLVDSGASWVRAEVYWANIERRNVDPEEFRWAEPDRILGASGQAGINMIATIGLNPSWASPHIHGPINTENLPDFAEFLTALVERYDGDGIDDAPCNRVVKHWEFFNEPDGGSKPGDVRWGDYGAEYAAMLAVAYPAVKAADPDAQVLFGGVAYDWFEDQDPPGPFVRNFVPDVLAAGGGDYFDVMNFHVYPAFAPNWTRKGPGLYEKAQQLRQLLVDAGLDKPFVITEAGNHSNADGTSPSSEIQQAGYVVKLFTQALAADIDTLIWFMLYDPAEDYPNKNGLVTATDPPQSKLAYGTFQRSADILGEAAYVGEITGSDLADEQLHVYHFQQDGDAVYVTWLNPTGTGSEATQAFPGEQAQILDVFGNTQTVNDADDGDNDGFVQVTVGANPLIVRITTP